MAKKKRKIDGSSGIDIGLVLTVSVFLILLTFFILLNSLAVIDDRKTRLAIGSLVGAFGSLYGGLSPMKSGTSEKLMPISPPMVEDALSAQDLLSLIARDIVGKIKIESNKDREKITIDGDLLFGKNQYKLKTVSYPLLNKVCKVIKNGKYPVEIMGHTDNRPAKEKGYKSNWVLSASMAVQVLKYFLERGGIPPERLSAYGSASYRPVTSNETIQSRAKNRRIEIILNFKAAQHVKRIHMHKPTGIFTYKRFNFNVSE